MTNIFKNICRVVRNTIKGEVQEIKELVITDEDKKQGKQLASIVHSICLVYGIPISTSVQKVIAKAGAYVVRDVKDGAKSPEKLIIGRIIGEMKAIKSERQNNK